MWEYMDKLPASWHSYGKVFALGHRSIKELLYDNIICEEKIDGSQLNFCRLNGELYAKSKGASIVIDMPEKMFSKGIDMIKQLDLHDGWTYRGEFLSKPKHNASAYGRVPLNNIIIFDIAIGQEDYLGYEDKKAEADRIGLETVPLLYCGKIDDPAILFSLLATISILGGQPIEGIVIKNYSRFTANEGKVMMGKYVSEKYKEVHSKEWKMNNPISKDVVEMIIAKLRNESRWNKAIQHLREKGEIEDSPRDIGKLIPEIQKDTIEECKDIIVDALMSYAIPKIKRGIIGGFPEWYKEELLKKQFDNQ